MRTTFFAGVNLKTYFNFRTLWYFYRNFLYTEVSSKYVNICVPSVLVVIGLKKKMNSNGFIRPFFAIRTLKNIPLAKTLDQNLPNENRVVKVHLLFCFRPLRSLGSFAKETFILI